MSKYNGAADEEEEPILLKEKVIYKSKKLYYWSRRNPLKVIIIALSIINFALILTAPLKDLAIEGYPQKFDEMQAVIDGLKLKQADLKVFIEKNKTRFAEIQKNADEMLPELFNMTTGPAAITKLLLEKPDFSLYHDAE